MVNEKKTFRTMTKDDVVYILYCLRFDDVTYKNIYEDVIRPVGGLTYFSPSNVIFTGAFVSTTDPNEWRPARSVFVKNADIDSDSSDNDHFSVLINPTENAIKRAKEKLLSKYFKKRNFRWRVEMTKHSGH